jgi:hypothetical protein
MKAMKLSKTTFSGPSNVLLWPSRIWMQEIFLVRFGSQIISITEPIMGISNSSENMDSSLSPQEKRSLSNISPILADIHVVKLRQNIWSGSRFSATFLLA